MKFDQIFQMEMLDLRKRSREAGMRNPDLAHLLNTPGGDPGIERLFESFAFLTARLQQKLDDNIPEVIQELFAKLWPNYLRCVPAASIIQYQPTDTLINAHVLPKGTLVDSIPVDGAPCRFSTIYDTEILPVKLVEQRILERNGTASLSLRFNTTGGVHLATLSLSRLRLFLAGEKIISLTLYMTLLRLVKEVRIVLRDAELEEHVVASLRPDAIRPVGFQENEGLCPYPNATPLGHRILQEYFCFPEKFLFVEISGLEKGLNSNELKSFQATTEFEIHFVLRKLPKEYASFQKENFQLFCTPIVNLFPQPNLQIPVAPHNEQRIVPDPHLPEHFAVYCVGRVSGWNEQRKEDIPYQNASFINSITGNVSEAYYSLRVATALSGEETETYITAYPPSDLIQKSGKDTLTVSLICTNSLIPKKLRFGDICIQTGDKILGAFPFKNIIHVTAPYPPFLNDDTLWKILSGMSLNSIYFTDTKSFCALLSIYDFRARRDIHQEKLLKRTLQGIHDVRQKETDRIIAGMPMRGAQTYLTLDKKNFSCDGDMYMFGSVLNEFMSMSSTKNSFHQLIVLEEDSREEYRWPAVLGKSMLSG
jgi:type VI secretion system protein ImpG